MDPLTHTLMGVTLRNTGFARKGSLVIVVIASVIPDFDFAALLISDEAFAYLHRGITHSALALAVFPLLLAIIFGAFTGGIRKGFWYYYLLSFLGVLGHLSLDVMNNYGIRLFAPLSDEFVSPAFIYYIDPVITTLFALSVYLAFKSRPKAPRYAMLALMLVAAYAGGRYWAHGKAVEFVHRKLPDASLKSVTPLPMSQLRWWFVVETGDGYMTGYADLYTDAVYVHATYPNNPPAKSYEAALSLPIVRDYLALSKSPAIETDNSDGKFHFRLKELSFAHSRKERFTLRIVMDSSGRVLSQEALF